MRRQRAKDERQKTPTGSFMKARARRRSRCLTPSDPRLTPRTSRLTLSSGFTYIALLAALVIIGITLGTAGKYWSNVMQREKEEELLFRGDQYRKAIEKYSTTLPGKLVLPPDVDSLLKDTRTPTGKRHLRKKFKDPMTGEDFEVIKDKLRGNRIIGVRSTSEGMPLKQGNFPKQYQEFENKEKYSEWEFKAKTLTNVPGQPLPPGQSRQPTQPLSTP